MTVKSYIRRPHSATASLTARQVAQAYNYPLQYTGKGATVGLIELGGGFDASLYPNVTAVGVAGGKNAPDGPNGADGEVQLDIEVVRGVASDCSIRVYFAPNSDAGFLAAFEKAASECDYVSISWGQAESQWSASAISRFNAAFLAARRNGVITFAAAGDSGADDSTGSPVTDYPASDPHVIGCGGTRLSLSASGGRQSETTWNDNPTSSATGGGVSKAFAGRQVPDVAGNADPQTGYQITVDGQRSVIGGTSAVAPLYAGLMALLHEGVGGRVGSRVDLMNVLLTNLGVCFDVTAGDNGGYRAGPGRDNVTGLGVVDGGKLLAVLTDATADPAPISGPAPAPAPSGSVTVAFNAADAAILDAWSKARHVGGNKLAAAAWQRGT